MTAVRWLILMSVALLAAGVGYGVARREPTPKAAPDRPLVETSTDSVSKWIGAASCAGRSCHGAIEPRGGDERRQDEFTTVAARDPHAKAYRTLLSDRSKEMVRRLGRADGQAHLDGRCLTCHATPSVRDADVSRPFRDAETAFGVGCESCHGPARVWLHEHVRPGRDNESASEPKRLDDAWTRARTCAGCHVGQSGGDVDHDLIAAGHPRLLFEFVSLDSALPVHWRTKPRDVAFDWFVGQIVSADASLAVLAERCVHPARPWPEFAEFDCYACHHDLTNPSWRQNRANSKPGVLPWNSWNFDVIVRLLKEHDISADDWIVLRRAMERLSADRTSLSPLVDRAKVSLRLLSNRAGEWTNENGGAAKLEVFLKRSDWSDAASWEAAEQYFFALRALAAAGDPMRRDRLDRFERRRGFAPGFISPRRFDPATFFGR